MNDTFRHQGLRRQLVDLLKEKGITNRLVLDAIGKIPRHLFMDNAFLEYAYQDKAFPIDCEQTISQPFTVAYQTQLLDPVKGEKVLEIGTGSGYQSCVLAETGAKCLRLNVIALYTMPLKNALNHSGILQLSRFMATDLKVRLRMVLMIKFW